MGNHPIKITEKHLTQPRSESTTGLPVWVLKHLPKKSDMCLKVG